jgi:hypothetical protein
MSQTLIKETAERFARRVAEEKANTGVKDTELLVAHVLADRYPGLNRAEVYVELVNNSVDKALEEVTRGITNRLINTGTLDMFGHPGFEVFEDVDGMPWQVATLRAHRLKLEAARATAKANADEHWRLWEEWTQKHARYDQAIDQILEVERRAEEAGYDPEEMTIEQAKAQGFATQS